MAHFLPGGERQLAAATLTAAVCLLLVLGGREMFVSRVSASWPELSAELDSATVTRVHSRSAEYLRETTDVLRELRATPAFAALDPRNRTTRVAAMTALLAAELPDGVSIEARDSSGGLLAYRGRALPGPFPAPGGNSVWVAHDGARVLFMASAPLQCGGALIAGRALIAPPPVSDRITRELSLQGYLHDEDISDVSLLFYPDAPLLKDGRYLSAPVEHNGVLIARAAVLRARADVHAQSINASFARVVGFLAIAFSFLALVLLIRLTRDMHPAARVAAISVAFWSARALLLILDAAGSLLPDSVLNPAVFASSFGFGIASSLGELTVTLLLFVWNIAAAVVILTRDGTRPPMSRAAASGIIAGLALAFPFLVRALAASLQSFVADSSLNYDTVAPLFSDPLYVIMTANVFLLAGGCVAAWGLLLGLARRAMLGLHIRLSAQILLVVLLTAAGTALYAGTTQRLLLPLSITAALSFVFLLLSVDAEHVRRLHQRGWFTRSILLLLIATLCSAAMLDMFMRERRHSDMEAMGEQLARPVDGWAGALVAQTLFDIGGRAAFASADDRRILEGSALAYSLWATSPLSAQRNNSAIILRDARGGTVSEFSAGIHPRVLRDERLHASLLRARDTSFVIQQSDDPLRRNFSLGITRGGSGWIAAVLVERLDPLALSQQGVEVLRNTAAPSTSVPEDRFVISTFRGGRLSASSDAAFPRGAKLPEVVRHAFSSGSDRIWADFSGPDGARLSLFIAVDDGVICLAPGRGEFLFSVYRWVRSALVHAGVLALIFAAAALCCRRIRVPRSLRFSTRLRIAFLAVAAIPVLLVWIFAKGFFAESQRRVAEAQLREGLSALRVTLSPRGSSAGTALDTLRDDACIDMAARAGREITIFRGPDLRASSRPELYTAGLLPRRANPEAYRAVFLDGADFYLSTERIGRFSYFVGYAALRDAGGEALGLLASPTLFESDRAEEATIRSSAAILLGSAFIMLLVGIASLALARQISRPLGALTAATRDIAAGNLDKRVSVASSPEISELVSSFNTMTDQLRQSREELAAAERDLAWKEMAKQVAHEIRNPLTPMKLAAQHLQRAQRDGATNLDEIITKVTHAIIDQIESLSRIADEFSRFARMPRRAIVPLDIAAILAETVDLFRHHESIEWRLALFTPLPAVSGDREEFSRAMTNVLRNAVQAISGAGRIDVEAGRDGDALSVLVRDTGIGIPAEALPRIFEPNFSTKTEGMGLGLAIVKKILDDMGGSITIDSEPGHGTTVVILLPVR